MNSRTVPREPCWVTTELGDRAFLASLGFRPVREDAPETGRTLLAVEAAARLRYLKPDGRVRDSFYSNVAPKIGYQIGKHWRFPLARLEAFERGEFR